MISAYLTKQATCFLIHHLYNTDYIYRTAVIRDYFEENKQNYDSMIDGVVFCNNVSSEGETTTKKCYRDTCGNQLCTFLRFMEVEAIYIVPWNTRNWNLSYTNISATTQKYINSIDALNTGEYSDRIVVMYIYNDGINDVYQYASLGYKR